MRRNRFSLLILIVLMAFIALPNNLLFADWMVTDTFGPTGESGQFCAVDSEGKLWITDYGSAGVYVFNSDGTQASFSPIVNGKDNSGNDITIQSPGGVAYFDGVVYIVNYSGNYIQRFKETDGTALNGWQTALGSPGDIDIDDAGNVFVIKKVAAQFAVYDTLGNELTGSPFGTEGWHINRGISVTDDGSKVLLADESDDLVAVWEGSVTDGTASYTAGTDLMTGLTNPSACELDPDGNVWISNSGGNEVIISSLDGTVSQTITGVSTPRGAGFDFANSTAYITHFTADVAMVSKLQMITAHDSLFISEVADPANEYSARFFELHNNSSQDIDFSTGWKINYYANDNTSPSVINLTGTLESDSTFIIANNDANFETIFGFAPDMSNSTFNSNGDDNMELADPDGKVIDVFGIPGEDGSGTDHEFSDGRAVRKPSVTMGNSTYDAEEWTILTDVNAPDGFDPGVWPTVFPLDFVKAYPSSSTEITIDYNIEVASADPADYSLLGTSGVTFTSADIDPTDRSIVTLTAGSEITADLVLDTLIDAANEDTAGFYAGLTPIAMTNVTNSGGYIENGHTALFHGIISANDAYNNVWVNDDAAGEYSGVLIYDYDFDSEVNVGDEVKFTAERTEYNNLTELENPMLLSTVSTGNEPHGPFDITGTDIDSTLAADTDPAEKWEGQLVKISDAEVVSYSDYQYVCTDYGGTTHFVVGDNVDYEFSNISMDIGEIYDIIGVVDYDGDYYRINPRDMYDIIPEIVNYDLNLTFEDDSDVANWGTHGESSGYTTVAHDPSGGVDGTGGLKFTDGGYSLVMKRPISATMGTTYNLSLDVKVANWATDDQLSVTVEGLSSAPDSVDIHSYTEFTTINLTGVADTSGSGYIKLVGNYGGTGSLEIYFDNLVWDDNATLPDTTSPTIVEATGINDTSVVVTYSEVVDSSSAANVANYSIDKEIGTPLSATVEANLATLIVDTLEADTAYTLTVNDVADTSGNVISANSEVEFMWEPWTPGPDLFISEYIEGSGNNKAIELYNPTDTVLDLSEYAIITGNSGEGFWYDPAPLHGMLPAGETYVIINPDFNFSLIDSAAVVDTLWGQYVTWFNGDDPRAVGKLLNGSWADSEPNFVFIDAVGDISGDPGTAWDVAGVTEATAEHTLIRKPEIVMGNPDWTTSAGTDETNSEWAVMNQNTVQFLGSHPHTDLSGPEIAQVVAVDETTIQVNFNEPVDSASAATTSNYDISTIGQPNSVVVPYESVAILTVSSLVEKTNYVLTVNNVTDKAGLVIEENTEFHFTYKLPYLMAWDRIINDFESGIGNWTDPNYSGSTYGVTDASSFKSSGDYSFRNSKSGKMEIIDDTGESGGWFVRDWNLNRVDQVHADSKLMMYVRGHDHDVKIRFVIRDDGSGGDDGYEAGPWHHITVAEDDWQLVSLDLLNDPVNGWITGDGTVASSDKVSIDCIQIACASDKDANLYFDPIFERYNNNPPARFTLIEPADGATITNEDLVQDSLFQVTWHAAIDPDPADTIDHYKLRSLDPDTDTLVYESALPDTSNLLPVSSEDNGTFKWCVQAYDTKGAYSVSDTFTVTFDIEVGVEDENALPRVFALHHNYPNPFNPTTTVKYDLPEPSNEVTLRVFNLLGNVVKEVKRQNVKAGYHKFFLDCGDLSSGVYFYQIRAGKFIATKKMTLLK